MPAITSQPDPPVWDVDADWWGPTWDVVTAAGAAESASPGQPGGAGATAAAGQAAPVPVPPHMAATDLSWGRILATTISLWLSRHRSRPRLARARLLSAAMLGAGLVAAVAGGAGLVVAHISSAPPVRLAARPSPMAIPSGHAILPVSLSAVQPAPRPVWLTIPAIGVKAPIVKLGLNRNGTLQVPSSTTVVGWYTDSPRPGETGSAVIAGHVDSRSGPGVFFWLRTVRPGDRIYVRRADGTLAVFTVTAVQTYAKAHFPTAAVYGPVPDAELRLITCGGTFDYARGSYLSNVVVYARLSG
jgi:sortase (surface protein transpeptidase)